MKNFIKAGARRVLTMRLYGRLQAEYRGEPYLPPAGQVDHGDLRRLTPLCAHWGSLRGRPIDRYYIENFLDRCRQDVRGRVLEVGDATYTRRYGDDRVVQRDVLNIGPGHPETTIVADLASADEIPSGTFDCVILTQTLQLIYQPPAAIRTLRRILRPGGVVLCTIPGITKSGDKDWGLSWYWSFTSLSARRLFEEHFAEESVEVQAYGNVLAASSFLYGLADHELTTEELDRRDPAYEVVITVRAVAT